MKSRSSGRRVAEYVRPIATTLTPALCADRSKTWAGLRDEQVTESKAWRLREQRVQLWLAVEQHVTRGELDDQRETTLALMGLGAGERRLLQAAANGFNAGSGLPREVTPGEFYQAMADPTKRAQLRDELRRARRRR